MLLLIVPVFAVSLAAGMALNMGIVVSTNSAIRDDGEAALSNQIARHVDVAIQGNANWFSSLLQSYQFNVLALVTGMVHDVELGGYNLNPPPSFYDYQDSDLKQPLSTDPRQSPEVVSFGASSYYYPGGDPAKYSSLSAGEQEVVDETAHLDAVTDVLYAQNEDVYALYYGASNGMFRTYPGRSTLDTDPGRTYNPVTRPWYQAAVESGTSGVVITSPYQDFNTGAWMITFAYAARDATSNLLGVAGADVLLEEIRETVSNVTFLETGKTTLFEVDGVVVADKDCVLDASNSAGCTYRDLVSPPISDATWGAISALEAGGTKTFEASIGGALYLITSSRLAQYPQYFLVVTILKSEITRPMDAIVKEIEDANTSILSSLGIGFAIGALIMLAAVLFIAYRVTKPIDNISNSINEIMLNVGRERGLGAGVHEIHGGFGQEESLLARNVNDLIINLQEDDAAPAGTNIDVRGLDLSQPPPTYGNVDVPSSSSSSSSSSGDGGDDGDDDGDDDDYSYGEYSSSGKSTARTSVYGFSS